MDRDGNLKAKENRLSLRGIGVLQLIAVELGVSFKTVEQTPAATPGQA